MPSGGAFPDPPSPTRRKLQLRLEPYPHASTPGCAPAGLPLQSGACALGLVRRKWSSGFLGLSPCGRAHYLGKWPWDRQSTSRYRRSPESLWFTLQRRSSSSGSKAERVTHGDGELRVRPLSRALCTSWPRLRSGVSVLCSWWQTAPCLNTGSGRLCTGIPQPCTQDVCILQCVFSVIVSPS